MGSNHLGENTMHWAQRGQLHIVDHCSMYICTVWLHIVTVHDTLLTKSWKLLTKPSKLLTKPSKLLTKVCTVNPYGVYVRLWTHGTAGMYTYVHRPCTYMYIVYNIGSIHAHVCLMYIHVPSNWAFLGSIKTGIKPGRRSVFGWNTSCEMSVAGSDVSASAKRHKKETPSEQPPPIPEGLELPEKYKPLRCRFCLFWSTSLCPYPLEGTTLQSWAPLLPWGRGKRDKPIGPVCKLCQVVHWWH